MTPSLAFLSNENEEMRNQFYEINSISRLPCYICAIKLNLFRRELVLSFANSLLFHYFKDFENYYQKNILNLAVDSYVNVDNLLLIKMTSHVQNLCSHLHYAVCWSLKFWLLSKSNNGFL